MKEIFFLTILMTLGSCQRDDETANEIINTQGNVNVADVALVNFKNEYTNAVSVQTNGDNIYISSTGLPDHKTPYWGTGHEMYEDFPEGYHANVNTSMSAHTYRMTIPAYPVVATSHEATTLGPIGMAINGVPIYNDREGGNVALDALTITTFDFSGAHPGPGKDYHYHTTGTYTTVDDDNLVGFLRDGFPIYGRRDGDDSYPADLDSYGGHFSTTTEFPNGIYHYHASNVNYLNTGYYILKAGSYYGTKGTFTQ